MDKHLESLKSMGIELTEEQVEQIVRASVQAGVDPEAFVEEIARVATIFAEIWRALRKTIKDMWDLIKEFVNSLNTTTDTRPERKGWRIPRKIIRDHQVLDRRPRVAYARSEI